MVYVPAGCFTMGSDQGEPDELPEHEVCLSAYWIGQTEVTNAQYRPCVEAKACSLPADPMYYDDPAYADYPVVYVRWTDASTFARWFGGSLPTEAQWEYAARGPDGWAYPWGSEFYGVWLNYCDSQCARQYHDTAYDDGFAGLAPVGSYAYGASWVGALDMAGNVWEWTNDWYDESYYATVENGVLDPPGPAPAEGHVIRGGGWNDDRTEQRASFRGWREPFRYDDDRGFRVVVAASAVP
jgi:formylglycine-generating enzyme required for sulfatase activity